MELHKLNQRLHLNVEGLHSYAQLQIAMISKEIQRLREVIIHYKNIWITDDNP
jgi:hypothetical protein